MALPISFYLAEEADNTLKANGFPETASATFPITTLTPANVAATETLCGNLLTALTAISLGRNVKTELKYSVDQGPKLPADSKLAQRENKWLIRYHDSVTFQKYSISWPCADLTKTMDNSEFVDVSAGLGAAVKTAFEAVVVSPGNGSNTVVLDSIQFVGRNI